MNLKKKTLLSAVLAIVLCTSLIAGTTFALFTSESKVNAAIVSGKVKISASIEVDKLYSATTENDNTREVAGTIAQGPHAATYYYKEVSPNFSNGGTATYTAATSTLELDKVTPGDKIKFNVKVGNESNVNIKYRVVVTVTEGLKLFNAIAVKIGETAFSGVSRNGNWESLEAEGEISDIPVEIYMPIEAGNEYQNLNTKMNIVVEAVQGNAYTADAATPAAIQAIATAATAVDSEDKTVTAATTINDSDNKVSVEIPVGTVLTVNSDPTLAVKVAEQVNAIGNITVLSAQSAISYNVNVLLVDSGAITENVAIANDNDQDITVKMFVGVGLTNVKLYHNFDEIAVAYDDDGYITFTTKSL